MSTWRRFVRFNFVGVLGVVVQLSVVWLLATILGAPAVLATAVGVSAAIGHNFVWHRRWTWADRSLGRSASETARAFAKFALANGAVSLIGNVGVTVLLASTIDAGPLIANAIGIVLCGLVNFRASDRVVFTNPLQRGVQLRQHAGLGAVKTVIPSFHRE